MELSKLSLKVVSDQLRQGRLTPYDVIDEILNHMKQIEPQLHSFIPDTIDKNHLYKEADNLLCSFPEPFSRPLLFGVPVGVKDVFNVNGFITRAGSKLPSSAFEGAEAQVVIQLKEAGAIIIGKTVSTEFAYFQPGPTTNPHNSLHTPGGSSSGSAAAVAAGLCPLALGTQTIASITRPAAYCGVIGFKPTYGRVSTEGVLPFSQSVDHVGFFSRDIEGMVSATSITFSDCQRIVGEVSKPLLALPSEKYLNQADEEALKSFYKTLDFLNGAGYEFITHPLFNDIDVINEVHNNLIAGEFARNHEQLYKSYGYLYSNHSKSLYEKGRQINNSILEQARNFQLTYREKISEIMRRENIDLWLSPSATCSAPRGLASTGSPLMSLPWTFTGFPTVSIPSDRAANGLPFGLQIAADFEQDCKLLMQSQKIYDLLK